MIWAIIAAYALVGVGFSRQTIFIVLRNRRGRNYSTRESLTVLAIVSPLLVMPLWPLVGFILVFHKPLTGFWKWFITDPYDRKKVRA